MVGAFMGTALTYYREGKQQNNEGNHSILTQTSSEEYGKIRCLSMGRED